MKDYSLAEETLGYVTNQDSANTDKRFLIGGSQNVLIDVQKKVKSTSGYSRLGASNTALNNIRNSFDWFTSTGHKRNMRFYDDELEVYLGTVDTYAINAWTRVSASWSTTERMRSIVPIGGGGGWWDTGENLDLLLMVIGDANIYEWGGGVAVVSSITGTTVTKKGTTTFAQNRFYTSRNLTFVCVRTGTEYTYTGGSGTTTLTGIADTAGLQTNDILVQKIVTASNKPVSSHTNHFIRMFENQVFIGSEDDNEVYVSKNNDYDDFSFSSPRVSGEGALLVLDNPTRGFGHLGKKMVIFSGLSSSFMPEFEQITVGSTLAETIKIRKVNSGVNQGALCQEAIVPIGDSLAYLTNEVALRIISNPDELQGINPKTFSNPIKPDFDAEDWYDSNNTPDAFGMWYKNILFFCAPQASHAYMLNFIEDADGKLFRFWNPPQILPVGAMSIIDIEDGNGGLLYGHSNAVPETYKLFDGASGTASDGSKLPIRCIAIFAYNNSGKRGILKTHDEKYVEGEGTPNTTDLLMTLSYDYGGATQSTEYTIDLSDETVLEGTVDFNSLAQQSLAVNPLGGLLNPPSDARKFRAIIEMPREDYFELQTKFETNEVDRYWAITAHGENTELSRRRTINKRI